MFHLFVQLSLLNPFIFLSYFVFRFAAMLEKEDFKCEGALIRVFMEIMYNQSYYVYRFTVISQNGE